MIEPAPNESPISVLSENSGDNPIRFGAMSPWTQPMCVNLVCVGDFVWPYLKNATCYGHETCTTWMHQRLRFVNSCGSIVTTPLDLELWALNSTNMCEFALCGWLCVVIPVSPESYDLWTWDLHHVLDTTKTEVCKYMWKCCDNPIRFGAMSPSTQPICVNLVYKDQWGSMNLIKNQQTIPNWHTVQV